jgi:hypothetical protein
VGAIEQIQIPATQKLVKEAATAAVVLVAAHDRSSAV